MFFRLIFFLLVIGAGWLGWRAWRRKQALMPPEVPDGWRKMARRDARLREALELRDQMADFVRRHGVLGLELMRSAHELLAGVADIVELRIHLERYLSMVDERDLDRDSGLVPTETIEAQRAQLEALQSRPQKLNAVAASAVADLRQLYLELVEALTASDADISAPGARLRARAKEVQAQLEAEREVRAFLARNPTQE